jgi:ribose transport system substrate-binding protein
MRHLVTAVIAGTVALFAVSAHAAGDKMTIAVFTKNLTNPAYEAFRIASDQIARATGAQVVHYVPKQPDKSMSRKRWSNRSSRTGRTRSSSSRSMTSR